MKKAPAKKDRHKRRLLAIRLPDEIHEGLEKAAAQTRRTKAMEVQIALEEYLGKLGLWPPAEGDAQ